MQRLILAAALTACATPQEKQAGPADPCLDRPRGLVGVIMPGESRKEDAAAAYEAGKALADRGDHAAAIEAFARAIQAYPAHAGAHLAKAESHFLADGNLDLIRDHTSKSLTLSPEDPKGHALFAQYLAATGDAEGAVLHYGCALSLDPELPGLRVDLAQQLVSLGHHQDAEAELRKLLAASNDVDFRFRSVLASALTGQGKYEAAAEEMARAARETKVSAVLYRRAADLYERAGNLEEAEALRAQADTIDPPPERREMRPLVKARKRKTRRKR